MKVRRVPFRPLVLLMPSQMRILIGVVIAVIIVIIVVSIVKSVK
jgi:hypothetical protein